MQRQAGEILHGGHLHKPVYQDVPAEAERDGDEKKLEIMRVKNWIIDPRFLPLKKNVVLYTVRKD